MATRKKQHRLVVLLTREQFLDIRDRAYKLQTTVSNMVRRALTLPEDRAGSRHDLENNCDVDPETY